MTLARHASSPSTSARRAGATDRDRELRLYEDRDRIQAAASLAVRAAERLPSTTKGRCRMSGEPSSACRGNLAGALRSSGAGAQAAGGSEAADLPVPAPVGHGAVGPGADPAQGGRRDGRRRRRRWRRTRQSAARCCARGVRGQETRHCSSASRRSGWRAGRGLAAPSLARKSSGGEAARAALEAAPPGRRARSTASRSSGSATPTSGSARCWKRSSTAATTGFRSGA